MSDVEKDHAYPSRDGNDIELGNGESVKGDRRRHRHQGRGPDEITDDHDGLTIPSIYQGTRGQRQHEIGNGAGGGDEARLGRRLGKP